MEPPPSSCAAYCEACFSASSAVVSHSSQNTVIKERRMECINATSLRRKSGQVGHPAVVLTLSIHLHHCQGRPLPSNLSSRPERTWISSYTALTSGHVCGFQ